MGALSPEQQDEIMKLIAAQTAQLSALSTAQQKEVEQIVERKDQASGLSSAQKWDVAAIVAKMAVGFGGVLGVAAYFAITNAAKVTAATLKAEETAKAVIGQKEFLAIINSKSNQVPTGSVVAFDAPTCPAGWTSYVSANGRVLIGAGQGSGLTQHAFQEQGGSEVHKLSVDELPPLKFTINVNQVGLSVDKYNAGGHDCQVITQNPSRIETNTVGAAANIGILPPFIALSFCKKE